VGSFSISYSNIFVVQIQRDIAGKGKVHTSYKTTSVGNKMYRKQSKSATKNSFPLTVMFVTDFENFRRK
jgi:hypothetical protein